jgi:hypothetical protein
VPCAAGRLRIRLDWLHIRGSKQKKGEVLHEFYWFALLSPWAAVAIVLIIRSPAIIRALRENITAWRRVKFELEVLRREIEKEEYARAQREAKPPSPLGENVPSKPSGGLRDDGPGGNTSPPVSVGQLPPSRHRLGGGREIRSSSPPKEPESDAVGPETNETGGMK